MFLNLESYSQFCKENAYLVDDCRKYPSHPPHKENFEKWIHNHTPGLARETAIRFRDATRHISFCEFLNKFEEICTEIREYITKMKFNRIIFYVNTNSNLRKSNFWLALYMFPLLEKYITHICTEIKDVNLLTEYNPNVKTLLILPDDASYSGMQMTENLMGIKPYENLEVMIAVAYISDYALNYIQSNVNETLRLSIPHSTEYFYKFNLDQKMYPISPKTDENNLLYTIYFDHKLPDLISIYQTQYAIGKGFGNAKHSVKDGEPFDYVYEPLSLVTGCELYTKITENPYLIVANKSQRRFIDLADLIVDDEKMCPFPMYKEIEYRYKGKEISDMNTLSTHITDILPNIQYQQIIDTWAKASVKDKNYLAKLFSVTFICFIVDDDQNEIMQPVEIVCPANDTIINFGLKLLQKMTNAKLSEKFLRFIKLYFIKNHEDKEKIPFSDKMVSTIAETYSSYTISLYVQINKTYQNNKDFQEFLELIKI